MDNLQHAVIDTLKKLLILLILLIASPVLAQQCSEPVEVARMSLPTISGSVPVAGGSYYCTGAATCTGTNPGECDVLCEDFEGSTSCDGDGDTYCRNGWTATTTNVTIDYHATAAASNLCGSTIDTGVLDITVGAVGAAGYIQKDFSSIAKQYIQCYLTIVTLPAFDTDNQWVALMWGVSTRGLSLFAFYNVNKTVFALRYKNSSFVDVNLFSTTEPSANTMYRIGIISNPATGHIGLLINGVEEVYADNQIDDTTITGIKIGPSGVADKTMRYQIDNLAVDDDTTQGACQ